MTTASETTERGPGAHQPLSTDLLDALVRKEASQGFLTVYAGTDPSDPERARIELKNACARLENGPTADADARTAAVEQVRAGVEHAPRGRFATVGFIPIGGPADDAVWVDLPGVDATVVVQHDAPYVLPLLPLIEQFGERGVVAVARDRFAVHHWSQGRLHELQRLEVDVDTGSWRDSEGPANAATAGGRAAGSTGATMSSTGTGDAYARKHEDATIAELARVAGPVIERCVGEHAWTSLVWLGDPAIIETVRDALAPAPIVHVHGDDGQLLGETHEALLDRVRDATASQWAQESRHRLQGLRERSATDRVESLEEAGTLAREGRVQTLDVSVPQPLTLDPTNLGLNALVGEVLRHGGTVRALEAGDGTTPRLIATLRW